VLGQVAYFNELAGGPAGGFRYLADSNLDWGQALKPLKKWMDANGVQHINLAYFGTFYATRGLTEVVTAIRSLAPEQRERVRLHVFTAKPDELEAETVEAGLDGVIIANPYVSYLGSLNLATRMDVLLVNDARTEGLHAHNPYLPSKWSDYAGSDTDVWAITETGSVLSTKKARYQSSLGDVEAARAELAAMLEDHV